jgi:diguanylate cyclase (GGDEF)-like protein
MEETAKGAPVEVSQIESAKVRDHLRKLDYRQWWLWSTTVLVLILLTIGVASFQFQAILAAEEYSYSFFLNQAVRALVGLVLVFCVYLVYQQSQIIRMRNQIADQIESLAKVESLTAEVFKLAALDQLTGLFNRRSGEQRLAEEMSRAARYGRPLTLLLLDVDGLKQINDRLGHAAGDELLKSFAEQLQRAIRGSDIAVRMGGDEFMVLLPECRVGEVTHVISRVEGLDLKFGRETLRCRFSRGWTDFKPGETAQEFIHRADEALYVNKRAGKNRKGEAPQSAAAQPAI